MSSEKGTSPLELQEGLDKDFDEGTQMLIDLVKELKNQIGDKQLVITLNDKEMAITIGGMEQLVEFLRAVYYKTKENFGSGMVKFIAENEELMKENKELRNMVRELRN